MAQVASFNYEALTDALPAGQLRGVDHLEFGVSARPPIFIEPTFVTVERADTPNVTLISARGATGKSVLAEALSADKTAPLWRLNLDKGVSADALESRLGRYLGPVDPLATFAASGGGFVVVDALDEARMRVSGASWLEFTQSVSSVAHGAHRFVMLGRERVLEDLWLALADSGLAVSWFEISHFDGVQRRQYVDMKVAGDRDPSNAAYATTRDVVLDALSGTVDVDHSDTFVGYAPVLDAVAALLAKGNLLSVQNTFTAGASDGSQIAVLANVIESLLSREQGKTELLASELQLSPTSLYTSDEQMDWLLAELAGAEPPGLNWCPVEKRAEYVSHVSEFLKDHPFRKENAWASPVFSAFVASSRFGNPRLRSTLLAAGAQTGLLFEFVSSQADGPLVLDEWQFAALHSSLLAAEWREAEAEVTVSTLQSNAPASDIDTADAELVLLEGGRPERALQVELMFDRSGELVIRGPAASLLVDVPVDVVITSNGGSLALGPDCFVRCAGLTLRSESVEISRRGDSGSAGEGAAVVLEVSDSFVPEGGLSGNPPTSSFELRVPASTNLSFPWVSYRAELEPPSAPPNDRAVRFLNMLMNLARSHGHRGGMAVFDKKLEGRQSVKGEEFTRMVDLLEAEHIVYRQGSMIFLTEFGASRRFSGKTKEGLSTLGDHYEEWAPMLEKMALVLNK